MRPNPPDPDLSTPVGRLALATRAAHGVLAVFPDFLSGETFVVVSHRGDRVARFVAAHVARAAGDSPEEGEKPEEPNTIHARPAPRAVVFEMRDLLGEALASRLETPLAARHVRVLWLTPHEHAVHDVPIETSHVVSIEKEILLPPDESLRLDPEEVAKEKRDVAGTWLDPSRYVPLPVPKGWVIDRVDQIGVLTVIIEDRLVLDLCATEMPGMGRVLFAALRRTMARGIVVPREARRVLDRLRNVRRPFKDFSGEDIIQRIFGESQVWAALVAESAETGGRGKA